jgi:transposase-like protein
VKQKNKPKCPKCSSNINVVEIKYGFPGLEKQDEAAKGQIEG